MSRLKKPVVLLAAIYAFAVGSGAALAYYTSLGAGTGTASVGSLSAPTLYPTVPGAGTVGLSWTAITPAESPETVTYTVSRDGGAALGTCTGALAYTITTCTDSGVTAGLHHYTVTAHWRSWTATSPAADATLASGAPAKLAITTQPSGSTGGVAFPTQPVVTIQDANGNTVTSDTSQVTLAITSGTGTSGASLTCSSNPVAASAGVASFSGCKIDKAGAGYTLTATDGSLTSAVSSTLNIAVGTVSQLVFTTQPVGAVAGSAFTTQPVVTAEDAGGNTVTGYAGTVGLTIKTGGGGTLSGCSAARVNGVVTFSGCKISAAGAYTLTASDGTLSVDSMPLSVVGQVTATLLSDTSGNGATYTTLVSSSFTTTATGSTVLLLITAEDDSGGLARPCAVSNQSGTPLSGFTPITTNAASSLGWYSVGGAGGSAESFYMCAFRAIGNHTSGKVQATFSTAVRNADLVVIELSGNNLTTPIGVTGINSKTTPDNSPVFTLGSAPTAGSAEILFGDTTNATNNPPAWSTTVPSGFTLVESHLTDEGNDTRDHRTAVYIGQSAALSFTGALSDATARWATIGIEIRR